LHLRGDDNVNVICHSFPAPASTESMRPTHYTRLE
jgi:hypothetical protein